VASSDNLDHEKDEAEAGVVDSKIVLRFVHGEESEADKTAGSEEKEEEKARSRQ
jgi:hypothetical protein